MPNANSDVERAVDISGIRTNAIEEERKSFSLIQSIALLAFLKFVKLEDRSIAGVAHF